METLRRILPALLIAAAILAAWELYCVRAGVSPLLLPAPSDVARALVANHGEIAGHALSTASVTALGFSVSVAFAFLVSVALHFVPPLERGLMPLFVVSQTVPLIALAPLMILWFGFGLLPKTLLVVLVTFFPMLVSLLSGYARAAQDHLDLLASMGAGKVALFRRVYLPSARAAFFAGLRISGTYAIVAAIFAEYAGARRGIGIFILSAKNNFRADLVLAAVVVSSVLTLGLLGVVRLIEWLSDRRRGHHAPR